GREVARLAAEADAAAVGPFEHRLDSQPVRLGRLRLLDAVAGNVGGVVEPREQSGIRGCEDFRLDDRWLARDERQRLFRRLRQLADVPHLNAPAGLPGCRPRPESPLRGTPV